MTTNSHNNHKRRSNSATFIPEGTSAFVSQSEVSIGRKKGCNGSTSKPSMLTASKSNDGNSPNINNLTSMAVNRSPDSTNDHNDTPSIVHQKKMKRRLALTSAELRNLKFSHLDDIDDYDDDKEEGDEETDRCLDRCTISTPATPPRGASAGPSHNNPNYPSLTTYYQDDYIIQLYPFS